MSATYRIASPFLIRLAGVPFDVLEQFATPHVCAVARDLLTQETELERLKTAALEFVTRRESGLTSEEFAAWRAAIRNSEIPKQRIPQSLEEYVRVATAVKQARLQLDEQLEKDLTTARIALSETSRRILPRYLVFGSGEVHHLIDHSGQELPSRNSRIRERERHLLLYLQRVAAKNDTFSEFGPSAWGSARSGEPVLSFEARPGIARRDVFLERWTAHALAAGINADPETFLERRARLNPSGVLVGHRFVFVDTGEAVDLTPAESEIVARCDGTTPIHTLIRLADVELEVVSGLLDKKILVATLEVPALEPFAFRILRDDVAAWQLGTARHRWLPFADSLIKCATDFAGTSEPAQRQQILSVARQQLSQLGAERKPGQRSLYAAVNPIAEECFRDCKFEISEALLDEVVTDAEPWIDFWRDNYAFVASRV
ncbi:MAG TPA: hypothetical protein VJR49_02020, partial [Chthoniobacterales bacterium]|nr:hypothetical protein [Chthoniobacterales bacterium]